MNINEKVIELKKLKKEKDDAKETFSEKEFQFKQLQQEVMDDMDVAGVQGIKADGTNFVPTKTIYGAIQDRSKFVEWAAENEPDMLEMKERKELLNEKARQLLDDGEEFPPGMGFSVREYIAQRVA